MTDIYQPYRDLLAKKDIPIHADKPYPGRYRLPRGGRFASVLINFDAGGALRAQVDDQMVDALPIWTFCAKHPVDKATYDHYKQHGTWPGDVPDIGHNSGDLSLAEQIKDYASMALGWLRSAGIKDKTTADMAANYRAKLLQFKKDADETRTAEKAPHVAAGKAVDEAWRDPIAQAGEAAEELRSALTVFMRAEEDKLRREQDAARKVEEARVAAERKRIEDERAKQMRDDPIAAMTSPEPELPMMMAAPEPVKVQVGGQRGRKTGLRTVKRAVVKDYDAALAHFAQHEKVRALIEQLAQHAARDGYPVPGVEVVEEKVAA